MKYYEHNITLLNGLWYGFSRGLILGLVPVFSQVVLIDIFLHDIKAQSKMSAYATVITFFFSLWSLVLILTLHILS